MMIKELKMKQDYDASNDSLFIYAAENHNYKESLEVSSNIILDFDEDYIPRAIEILGASKILNINKNSLKHLSNVDVLVDVSEELVHIKASFTVSNQETIGKPLDVKTINDLSLPQLQAHFELGKV
ncbi:MAG: hypothetical protein B655_0484 [Methanobacterium sp. Maddingley MBC34]|nr:MAG: hypothetical protein B655_0484 [Methanobacterium sp. Maddingley MBC34]